MAATEGAQVLSRCSVVNGYVISQIVTFPDTSISTIDITGPSDLLERGVLVFTSVNQTFSILTIIYTEYDQINVTCVATTRDLQNTNQVNATVQFFGKYN